MRAKAKSSSTPYPIWVEGEYITEPPIRPSDGAVRPAGHYIDKGGYPGANVYGTVSFIYELDGKKRMRLIPWNELTKRSEKH